jgi:hypothetical protein
MRYENIIAVFIEGTDEHMLTAMPWLASEIEWLLRTQAESRGGEHVPEWDVLGIVTQRIHSLLGPITPQLIGNTGRYEPFDLAAGQAVLSELRAEIRGNSEKVLLAFREYGLIRDNAMDGVHVANGHLWRR